MNTIRNWGTAAFIVAASGMLTPCAVASEESNGAVIVEWNQFLQQNVTGPPVGQPRDYAMLHIAMADAVVAIHRQYEPFHAHVSASSGASAEAAAAQAGHDVLVALPNLLPGAGPAALRRIRSHRHSWPLRFRGSGGQRPRVHISSLRLSTWCRSDY